MIDKPLAREHLKADNVAVEDDLLDQYIASSQSICEGYCNRKFYVDQAAKSTDYALAKAEYIALKAAYDVELDGEEDCAMKLMIINKFIADLGAIKARINGIVIDGTITSAMLWTLGHVYKNRQDVVTGQNAAAAALPIGAQRILQPYLWIGDLA